MTLEQFIEKWIEKDPENEGCYTLEEVTYLYWQIYG